MAPGLSSMMVIMPVIYLVGQVDFTDEMNVFILRAIFVTIHVAIAALIFVLYQKIKSKNDRTPVKVDE